LSGFEPRTAEEPEGPHLGAIDESTKYCARHREFSQVSCDGVERLSHAEAHSLAFAEQLRLENPIARSATTKEFYRDERL